MHFVSTNTDTECHEHSGKEVKKHLQKNYNTHDASKTKLNMET